MARIKTQPQQTPPQSPLNLGKVLFQRGDFEQAASQFSKVQKPKPMRQEAQCLLAACRLRQGKPDQALEILQALEAEGAKTADLLTIKGLALRALKQLEKAKEALKMAIDEFPSHGDAWHNYSVVCMELGEGKESTRAARKAYKLRPNSIETIKQLGKACVLSRDAQGAIEAFEKYAKTNHEPHELYSGLGGAYLLANQPEKAIEYILKALKDKPQLATAWGNLGVAYKAMARYDEAKEAQQRAAELEPANPEHRWNLSLLLLTLGEFKEGWRLYETRWDPTRVAPDRVRAPNTSTPMLQPGEEVKGKWVAVVHEQGLGDTLQFCRYAQKLKAEGARVMMLVPDPLYAVMQTLPWVDHISTVWPRNLPVDRWVFMVSLPHRYTSKVVDIPAPVPYLHPNQTRHERWAQRLGLKKNGEKRIALVWAGSASHGNDINRSMRLEDFQALAAIEGVKLYSIQMGDRALDEVPEGMQIEKLHEEISNFADTAAILAHMDALVTIDSSPAHIAGAMGITTWVMVSRVADFRWLTERTDSPWYPTMRLFRQEAIGNWQSALAELEQSAQTLTALEENETKSLRLLESEPTKTPIVAGVNGQLIRAVEIQKNGDHAGAAEVYEWVLRHDPSNVDAMRNLAVALRRMERKEEADALYSKALAIAPEDKFLLTNYANLLSDLGRLKEAEDLVRRSLAIDSKQPNAWYILAVTLQNQQRYDEAYDAGSRALELSPDRTEAISIKGLAAVHTGRPQEAEELLSTALQRDPNAADVMVGLALHLMGQDRYREARDLLDRARTLRPTDKAMLTNYGTLLSQTGQYEQAIELTQEAIKHHPNCADAHFNLALFQLTLGQFKEGWERYEWRLNPERQAKTKILPPNLTRSEWKGESVEGKGILIFPEQGFGDSIMSLRYAELLKQAGASRVLVASKDALLRLQQTCPYVDQVLQNGEPVRNYDYWILPMSLPNRFGTTVETIPWSGPYLSVLPELAQRWNNRISSKCSTGQSSLKVGLVWQGSRTHPNDRHRSIAGQLLTPLFQIKGVEWFALDKSEGSSPESEIAGNVVPNLGHEIEDFADMAAIIENLDLLITVDSAPAHVAGAIGKPCWVMLSTDSDFRWLLKRTDSPWYPSIELFRQDTLNQWVPVIERVAGRLEALVASRRAPLVGAANAIEVLEPAVSSEGKPAPQAKPAVNPPTAATPARPTMMATWPLGGGDGWPTLALDILHASAELAHPVAQGAAPDPASSHPRLQAQWLDQWNKVGPQFAAAEQQGKAIKVQGAVSLHAVGEGLLPVRATSAVSGDRHVGAVCMTATSFALQGVAQARRFDQLVVFSDWNHRMMLELGLTRVSRWVLPPLLGAPRLSPHEALPRPQRYTVALLWSDRYADGFDLSLKACVAFAARHDDVCFVVGAGSSLSWESAAGMGQLKINRKTLNMQALRGSPADAAAAAAEMGLPPERTAFVDIRTDEDWAELAAQSSVALFANRAVGGRNRPALLLMSLGVPVALSANTGHLDLIAPGVCYSLELQKPVSRPDTWRWGESSVEEMLAVLESAYADSAARARVASAGRAHMEAMGSTLDLTLLEPET